MTRSEEISESIEVVKSFRYFLDRYVWIEDKERKCAIKLELWDSQVSILPQVVEEGLLVMVKTRQIGMTWLAAALCLWLSMRHLLHLIIVVSSTEDHAIEFMDRVYFILDRLPVWMVPSIKLPRNRRVLTFQHIGDTEAVIKSLPTTEMGAESKTPNLLVRDEAHTVREVASIFSSSLPGIQQAKGRIIVIANCLKDRPGWPWVRDICVAAMRGENNFKFSFLPWQAHPGRPVTFKVDRLRDGMTEEDFSEHYPETIEEALSSAFSGFFGKALVRHNKTRNGLVGNLAEDHLTKEIRFAEDRKGILEVWRWPSYIVRGYDGLPWRDRYAIGTDISEGLGASYSVAYVIDRLLDEIVARLRSNRVDAHAWGDLVDMLSRWYDRAIVCPEVTGAGQTTVKRLVALDTNLYRKVICDKVGKVITSQIGWPETETSKYELCGDLRQWLISMRGAMYDRILLDECATFIKHEGTRHIGPEKNKFGDCVIAAGCAREADLFLDSRPEKAKPELTGWRKRLQDRGGDAVWAA